MECGGCPYQQYRSRTRKCSTENALFFRKADDCHAGFRISNEWAQLADTLGSNKQHFLLTAKPRVGMGDFLKRRWADPAVAYIRARGCLRRKGSQSNEHPAKQI